MAKVNENTALSSQKQMPRHPYPIPNGNYWHWIVKIDIGEQMPTSCGEFGNIQSEKIVKFVKEKAILCREGWISPKFDQFLTKKVPKFFKASLEITPMCLLQLSRARNSHLVCNKGCSMPECETYRVDKAGLSSFSHKLYQFLTLKIPTFSKTSLELLYYGCSNYVETLIDI